ncbi:MAG: hypothetical protein A2Z24_01615 [Candidatus Woykebacteria bacterium RBG_16_44_10]|uniref:HEPN domain-containing protein n=1 Tax=Candidatus Woykebacteria bacterium RBG_16_44_10 TaxID=1802597 RepID=A0A1G1WF10_9BACT|nr:MAG: hypothetical protein A2Z24_01615 [Candidatus Woykebacteria bacterium RBG_16_44_10]
MSNYIPLSSLAMDLKRAAIGYHRNSLRSADRFYQEALKRKKEIDAKSLQPYLVSLLDDLEELTKVEDDLEKGEKALLLATLFQNAAVSLVNNRKY